MPETVYPAETHNQMVSWLRGLLAIAWADGHYDEEEKDLIHSILKDEVTLQEDLDGSRRITPAEVAAALGEDAKLRENFMRTAVMVAIADGTYSPGEDEVLQQFAEVLGLPAGILESLRQSHCYQVLSTSKPATAAPELESLLSPVQNWLDHLDIHDPRLAKFLCKMIPPQCPFERDVTLFGHKLVHIPPLCKLNPLYEQLVGLRFRALSYLADDCGEDVSQYC